MFLKTNSFLKEDFNFKHGKIFKAMPTTVLKGLPENYFRHCYQAWQRYWNAVSEEEQFEGDHIHYFVYFSSHVKEHVTPFLPHILHSVCT
jgi:hypothetical protein